MATIRSWPDGGRVAVVFNIAYESGSAGNVLALGPMGNPLPTGIPDLQADSWGRYRAGPRHRPAGVDSLAGYGAAATVMVSGVLAEQASEALRELVEQGHDMCAHSYSQHIRPGSLGPAVEREKILGCPRLITDAGGVAPRRRMSPRGTP